MEAVSDF
jgi:hypothetical protein